MMLETCIKIYTHEHVDHVLRKRYAVYFSMGQTYLQKNKIIALTNITEDFASQKAQ